MKYAPRHPATLEPHYSAHVEAMTVEGLHAKADIAAELAFRDAKIVELRAELGRLTEERDAARANVRVAHGSDVWFWQGDGHDRPESLVCPVVMSADTLRALLEKAAASE